MNRNDSNGPKSLGDALGVALDRLGKSIRENSAKEAIQPTPAGAGTRPSAGSTGKAITVTPSMRKPPKGDEQPDFFVHGLYDVDGRDGRGVMDVALFRLSKKEKRAGELMRHELPDGYVEVKAGPDGMASVWDYDIVLMMVSHLTEAMNRHRDGKGDMPGRTFRPHVSDILKFTRRGDGSRQAQEVEAALDRLNGTIIKISRENGKLRTTESEGLISRYRVLSRTDTNKIASVEIQAPEWLYREVIAGNVPRVLTVHPDYFLIDAGIGRFLYRLARKAAGETDAKWSFRTLYERSGSTGEFKDFSRHLRKVIAANDLPEYALQEVAGKGGPMLIMTLRAALPTPASGEGG
jgi:plasmid replication initiation protein